MPHMSVGSGGYRPPLDDLGVQEIAENLVDNTPENRKILRDNGYMYSVCREPWGSPESPNEPPRMRSLLEIIPEEDIIDKADRMRRNRLDILQDPSDMMSEYVPATDLADSTGAGQGVVPFRVRRAARAWLESINADMDPVLDRGQWPLPRRCKTIKWDGTRCWSWTGTSQIGAEEGLCQAHNISEEKDTQHHVTRAREIVLQSSIIAALQLEDLAMNADLEQVRLKASTEILDRAGIRGGVDVSQEITVTHTSSADQIAERLSKLAAANMHKIETSAPVLADETVDAELVMEK